jgi:penicillin-binding protein 1A
MRNEFSTLTASAITIGYRLLRCATLLARGQEAFRRVPIRQRILGLLIALSSLMGCIAGLFIVYSGDSQRIRELERYHPITNTELYDDQGRVVGAFALQRRIIAQYSDYPKVLRDAVISIEDRDFEKHWGVSLWRVLGAAYRDFMSRGNVQGASTLTMQLARNLFLSPDRTYRRKVREVLLAIQIERHFTKEQIFTLYANQIYLGHGVYGFETGARFYFGKAAKDLTVREAALLAGLPKAPNYYSPINSPERAARRSDLVINAMLENHKISKAQAALAMEEPIQLNLQGEPASPAPYFVEEVRRYLEQKYGSDRVHEGGLKVYTSLNLDMQNAANIAVLDGLAAYERRHGWRAQLANVGNSRTRVDEYQNGDRKHKLEPRAYVNSVVTVVTPLRAVVKFGRYTATISAADVAWTQRDLSQLLSVGDIAYVKILLLAPDGTAQVKLEQDGGAQGALVAIDNRTGDIKAMVGGRDFDQSRFNRATQALRQVGSSFKPYVYTAAIDRGAAPDDLIVDEPVTFMTSSGRYVPHNYDGKFEGEITLRHALAESRNIPALKVAEHVGIKTVISYAHRFGISEKIPAYLPIALGAAELTLMEHTSAYSVFPNDGVRVLPRYIIKVTDYEGAVLEQNYSDVQDVISSRTARTMTSMLREVVAHGTAAAASRMNYPLAGKTGTTNNFTDAWFIGFSPSITCGVWIGFDEKKTLGNKETGAMAALPVWMDFMKVALRDRDPGEFVDPPAPALSIMTKDVGGSAIAPAQLR